MVKDGREWCLDVLDKFVVAGQSVSVGEAVVRRYRPVSTGHNHVVLGIYSSDSPDAQVLLQRYWVSHLVDSTLPLPHNKNSVSAWPALTWLGQNKTFVLMATGGLYTLYQRDASPCTITSLTGFYTN